jgi:chromate transporter
MNTFGAATEVFVTFLKLGLTSFGGPIAHIAYYRKAFIEKKRWLSEEQFAQLLMLCQFLPGPASSQLGFSVGLIRAGWLGGLAAFLAFSLPSAILLFLFAQWLPYLSNTVGSAVIHGLKLVALVVVAQAVWLMARQLTPDWQRRAIALIALIFLLLIEHPLAQIMVVVGGALAGLFLCRGHSSLPAPRFNIAYGKRIAWSLLAVFFTLLFMLPFLALSHDLFAVFDAFYHAGALVFGGGHVVLPLLEQTVVEPGWVSAGEYLAGYGAAQAVPGPVFSLAAYLGALLPGEMGGATGAVLAFIAIFLPGFLLIAAMLPLWETISQYPRAASVLAGVNASVVGLLAAALYDPIWVSAVHQISDIIIALSGLMILQWFRLSALMVVLWCLLASIGMALL